MENHDTIDDMHNAFVRRLNEPEEFDGLGHACDAIVLVEYADGRLVTSIESARMLCADLMSRLAEQVALPDGFAITDVWVELKVGTNPDEDQVGVHLELKRVGTF